MQIACEYGFVDDGGRIQCKRTNTYCGHIYWCEMESRFKQSRQAEDCPTRREDWTPAKKARTKK